MPACGRQVFTKQVYRDLLLESLVFCQKEKGLKIHAWIMMSNHVHLIISRSGIQKLEDIMRDLKKYSAFRILKEIKINSGESRKEWMLYLFSKAWKANSNNKVYQFWRQDNHPIELDFHSNIFEQKLNSLHENPVEAGIVKKASDYRYSSAIDYEDGKGLIEIDILHLHKRTSQALAMVHFTKTCASVAFLKFKPFYLLF